MEFIIIIKSIPYILRTVSIAYRMYCVRVFMKEEKDLIENDDKKRRKEKEKKW